MDTILWGLSWIAIMALVASSLFLLVFGAIGAFNQAIENRNCRNYPFVVSMWSAGFEGIQRQALAEWRTERGSDFVADWGIVRFRTSEEAVLFKMRFAGSGS